MTTAKTVHQINTDRGEVANFLTNCKGHLLFLLSKECNAVFSKVEGVFVNDHVDIDVQRLKLRQMFSLSSPLPPLDTTSGNEKAIIKFLRPMLPEVRVQKILVLAHRFDISSVQTALCEAYTELLHDVNGRSAAGLLEKCRIRWSSFNLVFATPLLTRAGRNCWRTFLSELLYLRFRPLLLNGVALFYTIFQADRRKMGTKAMQDNMIL